MKYDYIIVGAGLYGAVFAHEMSREGKACLVLEKRNHIAGNIYTEEKEGIQVHKYGAHIFHTSNREVWDYVNQFADFNHYVNSPIAVYRDELYNLPFNMNTFSKLWGIKTPAEAREKLSEQKKEQNIHEAKNLEEQALSLVGRDIYQKLIKGYTEKQWGRDCKELPAFIIKRLPLRFTYDNNYFNDRFQGIPIGGYTAMVEKMLKGIELRFNTDFFRFREEHRDLFDGSSAQEGERGQRKPVLVYTGMIDEYYGFKYGHLEYRSLAFTEEVLEEENHQGNAVVNYTEREIPYTRIIEHKHFEFGKQPTTVITQEYPKEWKPGDEPYYPINDEKNTLLYKKYQALAEHEDGVIFGGRLGAYRYYDMDKVIETALETVRTILNQS